jgi:hypothetical protein
MALIIGRICRLYLPLSRRQTACCARKRNIVANFNFLPYEGRLAQNSAISGIFMGGGM